ncbi:hypothetical protein ACS5NO_32090 [Larkinella sp. GY13]|uniref:hypothetical protein n=1 Tax=Larkinella sp. GY13 TaxID=3453720 RepID=UPI003EE8AB70
MVHTPQTPAKSDELINQAPLYTFADGILDVAYEEIAEAKANCFRAWYHELITKEVNDLAYDYFHSDYLKVGRIPYEDLQELIARYAKQNKSKVYQIGTLEVAC